MSLASYQNKAGIIEEYHEIGLTGRNIAKKLTRGHETIYRVIRQLKKGLKAIDIYTDETGFSILTIFIEI